ncbi:MAG: hypothetical protein JW830_03230 [Bacteroidales bacterium]|jgi:hypothetical protein|nr:hypothetical protein [Bacteroidales bacterium]
MKRTSTLNGSTKFSDDNENELIKLAGFLESEELEAVEYYLKGLQSDVNDDVVRRIVDFSRNYTMKNPAKENAAY